MAIWIVCFQIFFSNFQLEFLSPKTPNLTTRCFSSCFNSGPWGTGGLPAGSGHECPVKVVEITLNRFRGVRHSWWNKWHHSKQQEAGGGLCRGLRLPSRTVQVRERRVPIGEINSQLGSDCPAINLSLICFLHQCPRSQLISSCTKIFHRFKGSAELLSIVHVTPSTLSDRRWWLSMTPDPKLFNHYN